MRSDYYLETTHLGVILGAMGLGIAPSELPWGLLTDRLGDRRVLLSGLGLTGLVLALMALFESPVSGYSPSPILLGVSLLLVGLIGGSVNGSSGRAIMAWFQKGERGLAMSTRQVAVSGGGALGAMILPFIAASAGFQAVYGVLAALCLAPSCFVWLWLHEPAKETVAAPNTSVAPPAKTISPLRNGQVWRTVFGLGALCIPQVAVLTFAAVFLHDFGGLGVAAISASIVAVQLCAAAGRVWSSRFTDRRKNRRPFMKACAVTTAGIYALLGVLIVLMGLFPEHRALLLPLSVIVLVIGGIVSSCWHGVAFTELATIAGMSHVGTALGLGNTFAFGAYRHTAGDSDRAGMVRLDRRLVCHCSQCRTRLRAVSGSRRQRAKRMAAPSNDKQRHLAEIGNRRLVPAFSLARGIQHRLLAADGECRPRSGRGLPSLRSSNHGPAWRE